MVIHLVEYDDILRAVQEALEGGKGRNFSQSIDLAINLRDVDLSNPENRVDTEVLLPNGRGREVKVGLFCTGEMAVKVGDVADAIISPEELEDLADDKEQAKALAEEMSFFLAEAPLMPTIGRTLGVVLGPRGKMPTPVQPGSDPSDQIDSLRRTVRARSKDNMTFHLPAGTEDHSPEELAENIRALLRRITMGLERHENNLHSVYISTTMGPSVKIL